MTQDRRKLFSKPVTIRLGANIVEIAAVKDAEERLANVDWPERGPRHRDAHETCLKALDGHRSTEDARREFVEAAREAGVLVGS
jgi:hypothetical protein